MSPRVGGYVPPVISAKANDVALEAASERVANFKVSDLKAEVKQEFGLESKAEIEQRTKEEEEAEEKKNFYVMVGHAAFASLAILASLFSFNIASYGITQVASTMTIGMAPYTCQQRRRINKRDTMRQAMNKLRSVVNRLIYQNDILHDSNNKLKKEVKKLKKVEESLSNIVTRQGEDVDKFTNLVKENFRIQAEMKKYLRAAATQQIITAVLMSDYDQDDTFNDNELDMLVLRMKMHPDFHGKDMDEMRRELRGGMNVWVADMSLVAVLRRANDMFDRAAEEAAAAETRGGRNKTLGKKYVSSRATSVAQTIKERNATEPLSIV